MSVVRGRSQVWFLWGGGVGPQVWCLGEGSTLLCRLCSLSHDAYEVTYPPPPHPLWTDKCLWKHYLPTTSIAGDKNNGINARDLGWLSDTHIFCVTKRSIDLIYLSSSRSRGTKVPLPHMIRHFSMLAFYSENNSWTPFPSWIRYCCQKHINCWPVPLPASSIAFVIQSPVWHVSRFLCWLFVLSEIKFFSTVIFSCFREVRLHWVSSILLIRRELDCKVSLIIFFQT